MIHNLNKTKNDANPTFTKLSKFSKRILSRFINFNFY